MPRNPSRLLVVVCTLVACAAPAFAQVVDNELPDQYVGVGVDEQLGAALPMDLELRDGDGKTVRLGDFFADGLPVILTLNYFDCPMLCNQQLEGLADGLRKVAMPLGEKYRVVTVSINPKDTAEKAAAAQKKYLDRYERPTGRQTPWAFLVGSPENVKSLADVVGFRYKWLEKQKEYSHTASATLCSPKGKICRYLYGLEYKPETLRLGLVEASEGKLGTTLDRIILFCSHYYAPDGSYKLRAIRVVQILMGGFGVGLAAVLAMFWRREIAAGFGLGRPAGATSAVTEVKR
jgi:protein SCO1/2